MEVHVPVTLTPLRVRHHYVMRRVQDLALLSDPDQVHLGMNMVCGHAHACGCRKIIERWDQVKGLR